MMVYPIELVQERVEAAGERGGSMNLMVVVEMEEMSCLPKIREVFMLEEGASLLAWLRYQVICPPQSPIMCLFLSYLAAPGSRVDRC